MVERVNERSCVRTVCALLTCGVRCAALASKFGHFLCAICHEIITESSELAATMPLQQVTVTLTSDVDAAFVSDVLFELGAHSVSVQDRFHGTEQEQPIYGSPLKQSVHNSWASASSLWRNASIKALFPLSTDIEELIMNLATDFNLPQTPTFALTADVFDDKDPDTWVKLVQESFKPIHLGNACISFPWHEPAPGALNVQLEPGMAFGTGEHATTQLCVRWLQTSMRDNMKVLDYGTGSGVLAIFAVLLADNVTACGVDLDPDAVPVAKANAKRNGVGDRIEFFVNADEPLGVQYDCVVANIMALPLMDLAELLVSRLKSGGRIALSGILTSQAREVMECYSRFGVVMSNASSDSGWVILDGVKS